VKIPAGTIEQQLRAALKAGKTAEQAVSLVSGPYAQALKAAGNDALAGYARPSMLAHARRLRRQLERKSEDKAFRAAPGTKERRQLGGLSFHLHDGTVVSWAEATREQHEMRIAWLQTYITSLEQDLRRHERIVKLLAERDAEKLSDIDGWEELIGDELDEPAESDGPGDDIRAAR
jgi:hypothetical protein